MSEASEHLKQSAGPFYPNISVSDVGDSLGCLWVEMWDITDVGFRTWDLVSGSNM